jgi:hypothetical protein
LLIVPLNFGGILLILVMSCMFLRTAFKKSPWWKGY